MRLWLLCMTCWLCCASAHAQGFAKRAQEALDRATDLLAAQQLEQAAELLASLERSHPDTPAVLFQRSMLLFHQGDYRGAVGLSSRALEVAGERGTMPQWRALHEIQVATERVVGRFAQAQSDDGRYVVRYEKGKDDVLVAYALDVLADADRALQRIFHSRFPGPVRLEIYPTATTLAEVSPLTVEQIETSGTVALAKWNRLMITSPRALMRGYPWADTITHELVHLYITRITGDQAPVWLQEGTAKLLERSWRKQGAQMLLEPASRALLDKAARANSLLTFEQMHPSIAMLPSQDDAALAFAQVATFMERFVADFGEPGLRAAMAAVNEGMDARKALAEAAATPFASLEAGWKNGLPHSDSARAPRRLERRLLGGSGAVDETRDVVVSDARRFLRLGDLLWDRGRVHAAAKEYGKAHDSDPDDPIVAARLARAALESGDPARAVSALSSQLSRYPTHAPTHAVLGAAHLALGNRDKARERLHEAVLINPFDPQPHCDLARALDSRDGAERERRACQTLRGR